MYVDESGDIGLTQSPTRYFVLCGLVIHELRWREYFDELLTFRRFLRQQYGLKLREELHAAWSLEPHFKTPSTRNHTSARGQAGGND